MDPQQDLLANNGQAQPLRSAAELKPHPERAIVPALSGAEYEALRADIEAHGVLTPLAIEHGGTVLDGHHRLRAACELGLSLLPVRVVMVRDPLEFMVRAAIRRRQLSQSQLAALVVELGAYQEARAQARQRSRANLRQATEVANLPPRGERTREFAARLAGCGPRIVQDAVVVREADPELFAQVKRGELALYRAAERVRRARRYAEIAAAPPLPEGEFELIYADPPWQLGSPSSEHAPEAHYPTLPLEDIKALKVPAAEEAVLFLWAVNGLLPQALQVIEAWGFQYKTNLVWVKDWIGLGVWARYRHELLLVARRGSFPAPEPTKRCDSVIEAKRRRHSQKPTCVYAQLEQMYPHASKLELFVRGQPRRGWSAWGNEVAG